MNTRYALGHLTDTELLVGTRRAASTSSEATAWLLAHLAELDHRRLYLGQGKSSTFRYAVETLGLSEGAAFSRIYVARKAREFPVIFRMVAEGVVHLAGIRVVGPYLTQSNCTELLGAVSHKSKRAVEAEVARRFPQPDAPQVLRRLPARGRAQVEASASAVSMPRGELMLGCVEHQAGDATAEATAEAAGEAATGAVGGSIHAERTGHVVACVPRVRPSVATQTQPLSETRHRLQVTLSSETREKLEKAQQLLRHRVPNGDLAEVLDAALDVLVEKEMKRQFGRTQRFRKTSAQSEKGTQGQNRSRHVPHAVRREVLKRDGMQCTFTAPDGTRCSETGFLQLHHVDPFGKGGGHSPSNVRVYCRAHNGFAAEQDFGVETMRGFRGGREAG